MVSRDELTELTASFRSEAKQLLQQIGDDLLELERAKLEDRQTIAERTCRHAHNIKGTAATLGFGRLERLVHAVEDLLAALSGGSLEPSAEVLDGIFSALDLIDTLVTRGEPGEENPTAEDRRLMIQLAALGGGAVPPPAESTPAPSASAAEEAGGQGGQDASASAFIRISQRKLDTLLAQLTELVEMKLRLEETARRLQEIDGALAGVDLPGHDLPRLPLQQLATGVNQDVNYLGKLLGTLQEELKELRLVPVRNLFPVLRRAVRDVCRKRNLEVELKLEGGDYELDRKIVEELSGPLLHLLRNAVDHGMQTAAQRRTADKPPAGTVTLAVSHRGGEIHIDIEDDGRGLDYTAIHARAIELGLCHPGADAPPHEELNRLIFTAGFSTAARTDSVSGRGVGLDTVRRTLERLRGSIAVTSEPGLGTRLHIRLPLTLATDVGLLVHADGTTFAIPRSTVASAVTFTRDEVSATDEATTLWFAGRHVPIAHLDSALHLPRWAPPSSAGKQLAVVLGTAEMQAALVVDGIEGETEMVVRSLGTFVERTRFISGVTIAATGDTLFVLNAAALVDEVCAPADGRRRAQPHEVRPSPEQADPVVLVVDDSVTSRLLNQKLLAAAGYRTRLAESGTQALEALRRHRCDLVLSDVQMAGMDGHALTRAIKRDPLLCDTPVVLLTAMDRTEDREQGIDAGADGYLLKRELSQAELVETIRQLI